MNLNQVTMPASDMPASIEFYRLLGFTLIVRSPHYARLVAPDGGATLSLHFTLEKSGGAAPVIYFECDDLDAQHARLVAANVAFDLAPTDQTWLWREAHLRDPHGNALILYHAGVNRLDPPWRVPETPDQFHIVISEEEIMLVRHHGQDWRALQDRFSGYKASLGPMEIGEALSFIEDEWPDLYETGADKARAFALTQEEFFDF